MRSQLRDEFLLKYNIKKYYDDKSSKMHILMKIPLLGTISIFNNDFKKEKKKNFKYYSFIRLKILKANVALI